MIGIGIVIYNIISCVRNYFLALIVFISNDSSIFYLPSRKNIINN